MEPDQLNQSKTIYDASVIEIFGRNFIAGLGRALGGIFIYLVIVGLGMYAFISTTWPTIQPFIIEYRQAIKGINTLNSTTTMPGTGPDANQYQQILNILKQNE